MDVGKLTVDTRIQGGKNVVRRLRATGKVPGVCYGRGQEPLLIALDPKALKRALDPAKRQNTVITMTVNADGGSKSLTVMLKDFQVDALRGDIHHADFVTIDVNKEVRVEVPVLLVGKALGVVDGGQLHATLRLLPVSCKPADIPVKLEVDVTHLKIGDAFHVGELKLPPGVKAALPPKETIASIVAPKAEKVTAEEAAAPAEGAAAAPAEGAAKAGEAKAGEAKAGDAKAGAAKAEAKPAKEAKK